MPDLTVPAVLFALVLLILLGQWVMVRRARSTRGIPAPEELIRCLVAEDQHASPAEGVFFFDSPGCAACRRMAPVVEKIMMDRPVSWRPINVRDRPGLARTMRIMGTPTLILVHEGRVVDVIVGGIASSKLRTILDKYWPIPPAGATDTLKPGAGPDTES